MEKGGKDVLPARDETDGSYKWKLEDMYQSSDEWEKDFERIRELAEKMSRFKGKPGSSAKLLLDCLQSRDKLLSINDRLFVYARMKRDEDNSNPEYQAYTDRAMSLAARVHSALSYIVPEITQMDRETISGFIEECPGLKVYRHYLDELLRKKNHILSDKSEEILALSSEMANAASEIFTMFNNADLKFPHIRDEEGNEIELTKGRYIRFLESRNREVRQSAFKALYKTYSSMKNALASMLSNSVKKDQFYASVRNYASALKHSMDDDNISVLVYKNLVDTINEHLDLLHRYMSVRKKALNLDRLHMYDLYVPLVEEPEAEIPYEKAVETVQEAMKPLGCDYCENLEEAFKSGWIDVYENRGKTSGAYAWGAYLAHPYVLMNYQGNINSVFTLAHEMGHAMHSYYTNSTQPYVYSEYRIFVAEVASTVNEMLLLKHMLSEAGDDNVRVYLLNRLLESFRGTVFRQVMFAEFERMIHDDRASGNALTAESLSSMYYELNRRYFGSEVEIDREIQTEWARIPHFYSSFYVYKYATGFSAAVSLSEQILKEGDKAVVRYLDFLKSGDSDYPVELLKRAGVDLSSPRPVVDALKVFNHTLDDMEGLNTVFERR